MKIVARISTDKRMFTGIPVNMNATVDWLDAESRTKKIVNLASTKLSDMWTKRGGVCGPARDERLNG